MATAAQKKAQANMKAKMRIAKGIKAKNPGKKWTTCVKEAWKK